FGNCHHIDGLFLRHQMLNGTENQPVIMAVKIIVLQGFGHRFPGAFVQHQRTQYRLFGFHRMRWRTLTGGLLIGVVIVAHAVIPDVFRNGTNKKGTISGWLIVPYSASGCQSAATPQQPLLLGYNVQFQYSVHFRVQVNSDIEFTQRADRAFRQTYFSFGHFNTSLAYQVSDVAVAQRTEQFAFVTGFNGNRHFDFFDLGSAGLSVGQLGSRLSFQFGTTGFELFYVDFGSRYSFALREQEVTRIARTYINGIAQCTQVGYFF